MESIIFNLVCAPCQHFPDVFYNDGLWRKCFSGLRGTFSCNVTCYWPKLEVMEAVYSGSKTVYRVMVHSWFWKAEFVA